MLKQSVATAVFCLMTCGALAGTVPATLNVGVYPSYPPLDMRDPATAALGGFDIELSEKLAAHLQTTFAFQETAFAQLIASVQTGRINLFFNGMNDTVPRRELISFVDYLRSGDQFVVRAADAAAIKSDKDMCGKSVAVSRSTAAFGHVADWSKTRCEANGLAAMTVLGADNSIDARSQLKQGRVDAMAQDSLTVPYVQSKEPGTYAAVLDPFEMTIMGIGVTKTDAALQQSLASALQALIDDGDYAALLQKWGLPASSGIGHVTVNGG